MAKCKGDSTTCPDNCSELLGQMSLSQMPPGMGTTLRNGSGAPASEIGNDDDFYIDTTAKVIYGPKTSGAWGSGTSLIGPQGSQGQQGIQGNTGSPGVDGSDGTDGTAGADGKTWLSGSSAPTGGQGVDGDFYLNTSTSDVYKKAAGSWSIVVNIKGQQGDQGIQGVQGNTGNTGSSGSAGADGKTVRNGSGAPSAGLGVDGDFYIDTTAKAIYGPKTSGAWGSATSLVGPTGSDGWTYVVLAADFTTSSVSLVDLGLAFTPSANTRYEFEALLMMRTATATVGPRPAVAWPTGLTDGVAIVEASSSGTTTVLAHGNINAAVSNLDTGLVNTTQSWPSRIAGILVAGASPSGTLKLQLASETAGTNVTIKAGSFLKYRTY